MATLFQDLMAGLDEIEVILAGRHPSAVDEPDEKAVPDIDIPSAAKAGLVRLPLRRD